MEDLSVHFVPLELGGVCLTYYLYCKVWKEGEHTVTKH